MFANQIVNCAQAHAHRVIRRLCIIGVGEMRMTVAEVPVRDVMQRIDLEGKVPLRGHGREQAGIDPPPDGVAVSEPRVSVERIQFERPLERSFSEFRFLIPEVYIRFQQISFCVARLGGLRRLRGCQCGVVVLL
jgi:hypothetical protein